MGRFGFLRRLKKRLRNKRFTKHVYSNFPLRFAQLLTTMLVIVIIHTLAMMFFEGMTFNDGLWLSVTTLNTVGYGDFSSSTFGGRLSTIIFLYIFGISLLSMLLGEYMEYRINRRELKFKGQWSWNMNEHILIINTPNTDPDSYLIKLIGEMRKTPGLKDLPIQIVTRKYQKGLPNEIVKQNVVHCDGMSEDPEVLQKANVATAKYIFLLARSATDSISDSLTFDILCRIKEIGTEAIIAAELVVEGNRARCIAAGANIVVRPVRAYPELLIRGVTSPGAELILENLFNHSGVHLERIDCRIEGIQWKQLVSMLMDIKAGLPMAFTQDGKIFINPHPDVICNGDGLLTMIYEDQEKDGIQQKVKERLSQPV